MASTDTATLENVTWDLSHLLEGDGIEGAESDEAAVEALLDRSEELAESFARAYEGQVEELDGPGLVEAMERLAEISELAGRAANYAHLRFAADTEDPANGALLQRVERARRRRSRPSSSSSSSSGSRSPTRAPRSCSRPRSLEFARHHLRMERRYRPHLLSKPEETISTELSVTGRGAWTRLFDELTSRDPGRAAG